MPDSSPAVANRSGIQVIARAASILRALEHSRDGLSLGEIAKSVGLARSTVQRIVGALVDEGFLIAASPTAKVRLGPAIVRLAANADLDIAKLVHPLLVELARTVHETVDLAVLRGAGAVFVDQIPGTRRLTAVSAIGERFPLHCTANGKAMLACLAPTAARSVVARSVKQNPNHPLTDEERLWREVADARETALAFDREEHAAGICAVGTALVDPLGRPFAISIPAPTQRFARFERELCDHLLGCRRRVETLLD